MSHLHSSLWRWNLLCCGAALLIGLGVGVDHWLFPKSTLLFPNTDKDVMLYTNFIYKAAQGFYHGDVFLWEHRNDPSSFFSIFHFWPQIYGIVYKYGGDAALLAISIFLSGLWFYSIFRLCLYLKQPLPYAFCVAGLQTFFVLNFAYQLVGFKTQWQNYNFWVTEHVRLYPTVTAMTIYSCAAFSVIATLRNASWWKTILSSSLIALSAYGRPFDWMVMLGALLTLAVILWLQQDRKCAAECVILFLLAFFLSLSFIFKYLQYQKIFHQSFMEQMARGNLQVKLLPHYLKYALICLIIIGTISFVFRKAIFLRLSEKVVRNETILTILWMYSLIISALLLHFKTAFECGITFVGFSYLFIFSVIPWSFLLATQFFWKNTSLRWKACFHSKIWVVFFFLLLGAQQLGQGPALRANAPQTIVEPDRRCVYDYLKNKAVGNPTVLTLGRGLEASIFADSWLFLPNPVVATFVCSASTSELLERFLLAKLLVSGSIEDLAPLFSKDGLSNLDVWLKMGDQKTQFWCSLLTESIGYNTYIFHPQKNRGELSLRQIQLPDLLAKENSFVVYFTPELRSVFERCRLLSKSGKDKQTINQVLNFYRLDYIYIPRNALLFIDVTLFEKNADFQEIVFKQLVDGRLWQIKNVSFYN